MNENVKQQGTVLITGGIWTTRPVEDEPSITLTDWAISETVEDGPSRYFVGYSAAGREGRVSSSIVTFDSKTLRGVTSSGRIYELKGPSGLNGDAAYVLGRWKRIYGGITTTDITTDVLKGLR